MKTFTFFPDCKKAQDLFRLPKSKYSYKNFTGRFGNTYLSFVTFYLNFHAIISNIKQIGVVIKKKFFWQILIHFCKLLQKVAPTWCSSAQKPFLRRRFENHTKTLRLSDFELSLLVYLPWWNWWLNIFSRHRKDFRQFTWWHGIFYPASIRMIQCFFCCERFEKISR